jgi:hypothetical protein
VEKEMRKNILTLLLLASVALTACAKTTPTSIPTFPAPAPTTELEVPQSSQLEAPNSGCTVVARRPTPGPTQESLFPPVTEDDHVKGPADAKVTIIEYSDFQ